jgi:hypothetical protein
VTWMEQIENAIGESYPVLSCGSPALSFCPGSYFRRGVARPQSLLITIGWK